VSAGELRKRDGRWMPRQAGFPAAKIALRSASPQGFMVVDSEGGELLGHIEAERAFSTAHPGAIYLHRGVAYEVELLDLDAHRVIVSESQGDYYTQPKTISETFIEEPREQREAL